jgi:hypothetical protein
MFEHKLAAAGPGKERGQKIWNFKGEDYDDTTRKSQSQLNTQFKSGCRKSRQRRNIE